MHHKACLNVWFQKICILPPQKGLEIPAGGGVKNLKQCMELNWNFQRGVWGGGGGGGHKANPFHGGYGYFLEPHNVAFEI